MKLTESIPALATLDIGEGRGREGRVREGGMGLQGTGRGGEAR